MALVVSWVGWLIAAMGVGLMVSPTAFRWVANKFVEQGWLYIAVTIRVVIGVLFILAAPETAYPDAIYALGVLFIIAGVFLIFLGKKRLAQILAWWMQHTDKVLRFGALLVVVFGLTIIFLAGGSGL